MKIAFFEVADYERAGLAGLPSDIESVYFKEKLNKETVALAKGSDVVSVFINSEVRKDVLDALSEAKLITTRSTGFDHIDVAYAKERGIAVANVPAYGSRSVAEFTFALILNYSRKIFEARRAMIETEQFDLAPLQGFDLCGKTLGVVGTGKIGRAVIHIAKSFDMKVIACDMYPDAALAKQEDFPYVDLATVLRDADIVTLHTPYNKETHHLINKDNIFTMKQGALLVNTARGELIETDALLDACTKGHLGGVAVDVLEAERDMKNEKAILSQNSASSNNFKTLFEDHVLMHLPQVTITPHMAFLTKEAVQEIGSVTKKNIVAFRDGAPVNLV